VSVQQVTKVELVINMKTAKALALKATPTISPRSRQGGVPYAPDPQKEKRKQKPRKPTFSLFSASFDYSMLKPALALPTCYPWPARLR
jgi:hypothetical protein